MVVGLGKKREREREYCSVCRRNLFVIIHGPKVTNNGSTVMVVNRWIEFFTMVELLGDTALELLMLCGRRDFLACQGTSFGSTGAPKLRSLCNDK